jgi:hypothetical protein
MFLQAFLSGSQGAITMNNMNHMMSNMASHPASLLWGLLFGAIGMGYFVYGKKQARGASMLSGFALMAFPYFVTNSILIVLIGLALMAVPYFLSF